MINTDQRRVVTLCLATRRRWPTMGMIKMLDDVARTLCCKRTAVAKVLAQAMHDDPALKHRVVPAGWFGGLPNVVRVM